MSVPIAYWHDDLGFHDVTVELPITIRFLDFGFLFAPRLNSFLP